MKFEMMPSMPKATPEEQKAALAAAEKIRAEKTAKMEAEKKKAQEAADFKAAGQRLFQEKEAERAKRSLEEGLKKIDPEKIRAAAEAGRFREEQENVQL